jgi:hypothetical protein
MFWTSKLENHKLNSHFFAFRTNFEDNKSDYIIGYLIFVFISDTDYLPSISTTTTPATPANLMAQSMPPSLLEASTGTGKPSQPGNGEAVEALSRTCNTLQHQVEMLQSSLSGVMSFMTAFTSFDSQQQLIHQQQQQRTRHSSAASTNQDSFCYYPSGIGKDRSWDKIY